MWNLNQFNSLTFFRTFKVAERSLAVCEYMEFAYSLLLLIITIWKSFDQILILTDGFLDNQMK